MDGCNLMEVPHKLTVKWVKWGVGGVKWAIYHIVCLIIFGKIQRIFSNRIEREEIWILNFKNRLRREEFSGRGRSRKGGWVGRRE